MWLSRILVIIILVREPGSLIFYRHQDQKIRIYHFTLQLCIVFPPNATSSIFLPYSIEVLTGNAKTSTP